MKDELSYLRRKKLLLSITHELINKHVLHKSNWSLTLSHVYCYQGPKNGRLTISLGLSEIPLAYTGL